MIHEKLRTVKVKCWLIYDNGFKCKINSCSDIKAHLDTINRLYGRKTMTLRLVDDTCGVEIDFDSDCSAECFLIE